MDFVFWIILIIVIVGVVGWLLKRNSSSRAPGVPGTERPRADGALSGGSAAASAQAAGTTGIAGAAGFGRPAEPAAPTTADEHAGAGTASRETDTVPPADARNPESSGAVSPTAAATGTRRPGGPGAPAASGQEESPRQDEDEWETQWSEASGSSAVSPGGAPGGGALKDEVTNPAAHDSAVQGSSAGKSGVPVPTDRHPEPEAAPAAASGPVHHPEYTGPHAPTLPGAETAAVEEADDAGGAAKTPPPASAHDAAQPGHEGTPTSPAGAGVVPDSVGAAETADRTQSSALVETGADHAQQPQSAPAPEPAGHLAAAEPYGSGSAAAGADGSGPDGYTVKGDAGAMVYYDEGHPEYEQTRAEVWFESAAHAEAAGFRAPRRRRL